MSNDYRYFFGKDNPQRLAFEKLQATYSKDDSVLIVIEPKNGDVFQKKTLQALIDLTKKSWKLPYSTRVDSITNFQHTKAEQDDLIVGDLVKKEELDEFNKENLIQLKNIALKEPLLLNRIISPNADITAVNVTVSLPGKSQTEVPQLVEKVRELKTYFLKNYPDHNVYLTGIAMLNNAFNEAGQKDVMTLTPMMYVIILIIMFILLKSITSVLAAICIILMSILSGMGMAGWLGIPITPPSAMAPTVIVTLAVADSVHILKTIIEQMGLGKNKRDAIIEAMRINFLAVFVTSFTTVIGFLSLNFSDTPPFHDLGNITAYGVSFAFIYSIILLPILVDVLPMKGEKVKQVTYTWLKPFANWVVKHALAITLGILFLTPFMIYQASQIKLNDEFIGYFDESIKFRQDSDYVTKKLSGIYQVNYDLYSGGSQKVSEPEYLQYVDRFSQFLRKQYGVEHVNTITDTFKRLNKNMHQDQESFYKLPESRELAAQYLLLYEMSLPYGLDLNNQIDVDKASSRVIATVKNMETEEMLNFNESAENWLKENTPDYMHAIGTSPAVMFSHITIRNVKGMFWGTLLAMILITIVMMFSVKSIKYGLISLVPNVVPWIFAFGFWNILVGEAGFAIAIVGSVTLGIIVDDSVHFMTKYVRAKREHNMTTKDAILYVFHNVGSALVITSVILVIGFLVLMLSPFKVNVVLGGLSAMTVGIALIVDFLLLPAILVLFDKNKIKES